MSKKKKVVVDEDRFVNPIWEKEFVQNYWLNLGDTSKLDIKNPFDNRAKEEIENPAMFCLDLMRRPEYFGFTVKHLFGKTLAPFQLAVLKELWVRPFPMLIAARGFGKSWTLALYAMLKGLFCQGTKIVVVGAAFRQSKVIFDYCQDLWDNGPIFRDIVGADRRNGPKRDIDRCTLRIGDSLIIVLPLGNGDKIRGQRANIVIADEFASIPKEIFETVVRGFASVSQNPVDKLQREYRKLAIKELGKWTKEHEALENAMFASNQTIISGTASYAFNHFCEYWKRYRAIVNSKGDINKLAEVFNGAIPDNFNWKDYSVIRIPVDKIPVGFMDPKQIAQAKATVHIGTYNSEYGTVFISDSNGFYRRSLIESCVVGKDNNPIIIDDAVVKFSPVLRGDPTKKYVISVDPASERDNFSISILELVNNHRRIVYSWTTTRARFKEKIKKGLVKEQNFYNYCARKIRDLIKDFPCERLVLDSQGGGISIIEALQDSTQLQEGEQKILPIIDDNDRKETDGISGLHILEIFSFAKADLVRDANHGMRKDFEDRVLLFPCFDPALLAKSYEDDKLAGRIKIDQTDYTVEKLYDTLEDCYLEIEDLKDELTSIVHTQTGVQGRDHWDTPEVKQEGGKKGRLRKDRYSALLMANMVARTIQRTPVSHEYESTGGFAQDLNKRDKSDSAMWVAAGGDGGWWAEQIKRGFANGSGYGAVARKRS